MFDGISSHHNPVSGRILRDNNGMVNGYRSVDKVNGLPTQPSYLAASQSIIGRQLDQQFQRIALNGREQLLHFFRRVGVSGELSFGWTLDQGNGIAREDIPPCRIRKCFVQHRVIMQYGVGAKPLLIKRLIEPFNVNWFHST